MKFIETKAPTIKLEGFNQFARSYKGYMIFYNAKRVRQSLGLAQGGALRGRLDILSRPIGRESISNYR